MPRREDWGNESELLKKPGNNWSEEWFLMFTRMVGQPELTTTHGRLQDAQVLNALNKEVVSEMTDILVTQT